MGLSRGNWSDEGFAAQDVIHVDGFSGHAKGEHRVLSVSNDGKTLTITSDGVATETQMASSADVNIDAAGAPMIQRDAGNWLTDSFEAGQWIVVSGSEQNNGFYLIDSVSESLLTLERGTGSHLTDEERVGVSIIAYEPHVSVVGTGTSSREVPTTMTVYSSDVRDVIYQTVSTAGDTGNVTINATGDLMAGSVQAPFGSVLMTATESIAFEPAAVITGLNVTLGPATTSSSMPPARSRPCVDLRQGRRGESGPGHGDHDRHRRYALVPICPHRRRCGPGHNSHLPAPSLGITLVEGQGAGDDMQILAANSHWAPIVVFGDYADADVGCVWHSARHRIGSARRGRPRHDCGHGTPDSSWPLVEPETTLSPRVTVRTSSSVTRATWYWTRADV